MYYKSAPMPRAFIWRRIQSLAGLGIVIFLIFHLITNSQAALLIGHDGEGFIEHVNKIHKLPYLIIIEIFLIGVPIVVHTIWGIQYLFEARFNSFTTNGSAPALPEYPRNQAFTFQRITAWILLVGIVAHVINMRVINYPSEVKVGDQHYYLVHAQQDPGLATLAHRISLELYTPDQVQEFLKSLPHSEYLPTDSESVDERVASQTANQQIDFARALDQQSIGYGHVVAVAKDFGTAELIVVREAFKSPLKIFLYTIFVIAACFHAFNGLWTFLITWGVILTAAAQTLAIRITTFLMLLFTALGLSAVWLTYWVNLKS
jgi:succinate dehydrogenase / fumarate reductase cytochrome b subunit